MVESDKKRLRDARNKEAGNTCGYGEQQKNSNSMQVDGTNETDGRNDQTIQNNHFLSAGPGKQACREQ